MPNDKDKRRSAVLDPIDRVTEVVFGVLMALSFTGTLSVAMAGAEEVRTMLFAALGCNIAWGLADAVMFLVGAQTEISRKVALLRRLHAARDAKLAHRLIADELPERLVAGAGPDALEALRKRLIAMPIPNARLSTDHYVGALGVFILVVLATFPVVVPFTFIPETMLALRVSNALALVTLFVGGLVLGRHANGKPWHYGVSMAATGAVLVAAIVALGG